MQLLLIVINRTPKVIILAFTLGLFFVSIVNNLISVFGRVLEVTSVSSVNDDDNNNTSFQRIDNTTNTTAGGLSASCV